MKKKERGSVGVNWLVLLIIALVVLVLVILFVTKIYRGKAPALLEQVFGGLFKNIMP